MNFLYIPASYQMRYVPAISRCIKSPHRIYAKGSATESLMDVNLHISNLIRQGKQIHGIIVSDPRVVQLYLTKLYGITASSKSDATLDAYQGCMFSHKYVNPRISYEIPVVVIQNPEFIQYSKKYEHIATRFISKLYDPTWLSAPRLDWEVGDPDSNLPELFKRFSSSDVKLISLDIETKLEEVSHRFLTDLAMPVAKADGTIINVPCAGLAYDGVARTASGAKSKSRLAALCPIITMVGFTAIFENGGKLTSKTVVIPMRSMRHYDWVAKFCDLPAPKVMHNGSYDATNLLRYDIHVRNWVFDTMGMMHSWMVELPRSLAFTSAYVVRNAMYWKDESSSNMLEYNAKDCHQTAWACLALMKQMPDWAKDNYVSNFKQVFPAITCALEGFKQDKEEERKLWTKYRDELDEVTSWWHEAVKEHFNVNSPVQVKQLFQQALRTGIKSTDKNSLESIVHKHPLWRLLVEKLMTARKLRKADSTYLNIVTFAGRILYSLDPFGTETGRYASRESAFWCGTQIQNQPGYIKSMFIADDGYVIQAIDNSQAESRTTAYITGEERLIDAVENSKDFHTRNASLFFGIPEDKLWELKKTDVELYKKYRNKIGKRVNHGANYNMGEEVLITTMTPTAIIEAKHTLKLPSRYTFREVAAYLLSCFDKAYPKIRSKEKGGYHYSVIEEVRTTHMLTNPDGWKRYTFLRPWESKPDLNACVAHKPQSWAVKIVNRAFFDAWHQLQIEENVIRMKAQVHDEIVFQCKPELLEYATERVSELMRRPNKYTAATSGLGVDGEMIIPNDPSKTGGLRWSDLKD